MSACATGSVARSCTSESGDFGRTVFHLRGLALLALDRLAMFERGTTCVRGTLEHAQELLARRRLHEILEHAEAARLDRRVDGRRRPS